VRASKGRSFCIRSDYQANRETRASFHKSAEGRAFGLYRPVVGESRTRLQRGLVEVMKEIKEGMEWFGVAMPKELKEVGVPHVTYLGQGSVSRAIKQGAISAIDFESLNEGVEAFNQRLEDDSRVKIADFEWLGNNERKFAGRLAMGSQRMLGAGTENIDDFLEESGVVVEDQITPDHLTLYSYKPSRKPSVAVKQRAIIDSVVSRSFSDYCGEYIQLGPLTTELVTNQVMAAAA
jgi:hypothetical protein